MNDSPQGTNVLANEALGSYILRGLGLSVPRTVPVYLNSETIAEQNLAFDVARGQKSIKPGWHLAIEFVNARDQALFEWVPPSYRSRFSNPQDLLAVYIFDIWASHQDIRQCVFERDPLTRNYRVWLIDNGHLFGGPDWTKLDAGPRRATSVHVVPPETMNLEVYRWIYQFRKHLPQLLQAGLESVPGSWYKDDSAALESCLLRRLANLGRFG